MESRGKDSASKFRERMNLFDEESMAKLKPVIDQLVRDVLSQHLTQVTNANASAIGNPASPTS